MAELAQRRGRRLRSRSESLAVPKLPRILRNPYPPIAQFSEDEIEAIRYNVSEAATILSSAVAP